MHGGFTITCKGNGVKIPAFFLHYKKFIAKLGNNLCSMGEFPSCSGRSETTFTVYAVKIAGFAIKGEKVYAQGFSQTTTPYRTEYYAVK